MIAAGSLEHRITLQPATFAQDAFGASVPAQSPAQVFTHASVRQQSAAEKQRNGITATDNAFVIRVRYRPNVDSTWVVLYRGRTLSITGVVEGGRMNREWLDITAVESK